jgi:hypothetical protein
MNKKLHKLKIISIMLFVLFVILIATPMLGCNSNNTTTTTSNQTQVEEKPDPYVVLKETLLRSGTRVVITNEKLRNGYKLIYEYNEQSDYFTFTLYCVYWSNRGNQSGPMYRMQDIVTFKMTSFYKNGYQVSLYREVLEDDYGKSYKIFYVAGHCDGKTNIDAANYTYKIYETDRTEESVSTSASLLLKDFFQSFKIMVLENTNLVLADFGIQI